MSKRGLMLTWEAFCCLLLLSLVKCAHNPQRGLDSQLRYTKLCFRLYHQLLIHWFKIRILFPICALSQIWLSPNLWLTLIDTALFVLHLHCSYPFPSSDQKTISQRICENFVFRSERGYTELNLNGRIIMDHLGKIYIYKYIYMTCKNDLWEFFKPDSV